MENSYKDIFNAYRSSIINKNIFEKELLNKDSELYYKGSINHFINYRNKQLRDNNNLNSRLGLLIPFNNQLKLMLETIIRIYKGVVNWEQGTPLNHLNNYVVIFCHKTDFIKHHFTPSILLNYDNDKVFAFELNEYCLNGFNMAVKFLKNELLIDITKSPLFTLIKDIINEYEGLFDVDKVKIFSTASKKSTDTILQEQKKDTANYKHTHIFRDNAFDVWEAMFNDFGIKESSRTDIKFMYEEMKKDGLIFNTITQKNILNWISETYQIEIEKTSNYSKTKTRVSIYSNAKRLYQI